MQQTCALGQRHIDAQLAREQTRDVRDLNGVVQDVLAVGSTVFLTAQQFDDLRVQIVDARLKRGALTLDLTQVIDPARLAMRARETGEEA